jgi:hypothetical protein
MLSKLTRPLLFAGLTAVLAGYFAVWLPGPGAGLSLIGLEIGEWIKFLGVGRSRDLFYLPPITLGLMLVLMTAPWPNAGWQTWFTRFMGIAISLLSFPAIEAIRFEPASEWLLRLFLIGAVILAATTVGLAAWNHLWARQPRLCWLLLVPVGLCGAILPTWAYMTIRPVASRAFDLPVGIGLGVWLNGMGHLTVAIIGLIQQRRPATPG